MRFIKNTLNKCINKMCYKRLLFIFINLIIVTTALDVPNNPCRNIFQYKFENNIWFGVISFVVPDIGQAKLKLSYSLGHNISNGYEGDLEKQGDEKQFVSRIKSGQPLQFNFIFPLQNSLPNILFIKLNEIDICIGQEIPKQVVKVVLEHNFNWSIEFSNNAINPYPYPLKLPIPQYRPPVIQPPLPPPPPPHQNDLSSGFEEVIKSLNQICGINDPSQPVQLIYNGEPALYQPWLTALFRNKVFVCGGNIVTNYHIITAAHCVEDVDRTELLIKMGTKNINDLYEPNSVIRPARTIDPHPEYSKGTRTSHADIAIIGLLEKVTFSTLIRPLCLWLYDNDQDRIVGSEGTVAGWGTDENGDRTALPKKTSLKVISRHKCRQTEQLNHLVTDKTFCAEGIKAGNGPCKGDSGGALSMYLNNRWTMRGVVSVALGQNEGYKCDVNSPSVYADVAKFMHWIFFILKRDL